MLKQDVADALQWSLTIVIRFALKIAQGMLASLPKGKQTWKVALKIEKEEELYFL